MAVVGLVATVVVMGCESDGPWIEAVEPARGAIGTTVIVRGTGFCGDVATDGASCAEAVSGSVVFGLGFPAARASVLAWTAGAISVTVPDAAARGSVAVVVTVDGRSSNGVRFEVTP